MGENWGGGILSTNLHQSSQIRFVEMSVDLWTIENVANVKMLPVPVFNTNEAWGRVMGWSGEW